MIGDGTTAFVLAGGGSLGAVVVGMLREVLRAGVVPDLVVGGSAGAINAAYFAGRPTLDGVASLEGLWCKLTSAQIFGARWRSLIAALRRHEALCSAQALRSLLEVHLPYRDLSESALPVHVIASDLATGEEVVLAHRCATNLRKPAQACNSVSSSASNSMPAPQPLPMPPIAAAKQAISASLASCGTQVSRSLV